MKTQEMKMQEARGGNGLLIPFEFITAGYIVVFVILTIGVVVFQDETANAFAGFILLIALRFAFIYVSYGINKICDHFYAENAANIRHGALLDAVLMHIPFVTIYWGTRNLFLYGDILERRVSGGTEISGKKRYGGILLFVGINLVLAYVLYRVIDNWMVGLLLMASYFVVDRITPNGIRKYTRAILYLIYSLCWHLYFLKNAMLSSFGECAADVMILNLYNYGVMANWCVLAEGEG